MTRPLGLVMRLLPRQSPGECTRGSAATFDQARADFEAAWEVFLADRTEADLRNGATSRHGRRRNIGGLTVRTIGGRAHEVRRAERLHRSR